MTINSETLLYGSFSTKPGNRGSKFFNDAFSRHGINAIYKSYYIEDIQQGVQAARVLNFGGFAVAMPHKKAILPFLDEVDPIAQAIGAVNTVVRVENKFIGYNTDYLGFCKIVSILRERGCIVVGNGGLSSAVVYCLKEQGVKYSMITRDNWSELDLIENETLVNCTPVPLSTIHSSNQVIDLNIGHPFGDILHAFQAQEQFKLYTGAEYES
jgi:shikimate dehydrogenase